MIRCGLVTREEGGHRYNFGLLTYRISQVASHDHTALSLLEPHFDAFVAKLNTTGSGLVYSTYLGGSGYDHGFAIAVDAGGQAHVHM